MPLKRVRLQPEVPTAPEVWLLGSSDYSGALAAQLGLPFSFARFINPRGGEEATRAMVCTFAICAEEDVSYERLIGAF